VVNGASLTERPRIFKSSGRRPDNILDGAEPELIHNLPTPQKIPQDHRITKKTWCAARLGGVAACPRLHWSLLRTGSNTQSCEAKHVDLRLFQCRPKQRQCPGRCMAAGHFSESSRSLARSSWL